MMSRTILSLMLFCIMAMPMWAQEAQQNSGWPVPTMPIPLGATGTVLESQGPGLPLIWGGGGGIVTTITGGNGVSASPSSGNVTIGLTPIANSTILGNISGVIAAPGAISQAQLTALINGFSTTSTTPGIVAGSNNADNTHFLRADDTWVVPSVSLTQSPGDNTTNIATTAFVTAAIEALGVALNPAVAVQAATATILPNSPVYVNGVAGVGATLTSGTNAALVVDDYPVLLNNRVLVKNQAIAANNGVYTETTLGSGLVKWVLTRASDYNSASYMNNTGAIPVANGTVNTNTSWFLTSQVITIGSDALTYTQLTQNPATVFNSAGTGLSGTGSNTVSLTSPVAIANGGTSNASLSVTAGSILYGNGTLVTSLAPTTNNGWVLGYDTGTNAPTWIAPPSSGVTSVTGDGTVDSSTPSGTGVLTLLNAAANTVLGNNTGSTAAPSYTSAPSVTSLSLGGTQYLYVPGGDNTCTALGNGALVNFSTANHANNYNVAVGMDALGGGSVAYPTRAYYCTAVGTAALGSNVNVQAVSDTAVGDGAMYNVQTGGYSVAVGTNAARNAFDGQYNTAVGFDSYLSVGGSVSGSKNNTAAGAYSLMQATGIGNTALGYNAGSHVTSGAPNLLLGYGIAQTTLTTGGNNIILGTNGEDTPSGSTSNYLNIGSAIYGTGIEGGTVQIGINQAAPAYTLDVNGTFHVSGNVALSGTITSGTWNGSALGLAYGGTANGSLSSTAGSVLYMNGTQVVALAPTTNNGYVLAYNTTTNAPNWAAPGAGISAIAIDSTKTISGLTFSGSTGSVTLQAAGTKGDIPYISATNVSSNLGIGASGNLLYTASTGIPAWATDTAISAGQLTLGSATGPIAGSLVLYGATSGTCTLRTAAAAGTSTVFQFPTTNGSNTNLLQTDGSGNTSWVASSGPSGNQTALQLYGGPNTPNASAAPAAMHNYDATALFGGSGNLLPAPTSGTLTGDYYTSANWTSSGTITCNHCRLFFGGTVTINNAITVTAETPGGPPGLIASNAGCGICPGVQQGNGAGAGGGGGHYGAGGAPNQGVSNGISSGTYGLGFPLFGSGGAGGSAGSQTGGAGGTGGGYCYIEALGNVAVNANISANGATGAAGGTSNSYGGGGGSGGSVIISSYGTVTVATGVTIAANGATGSAGSGGATGGGGGGGIVSLHGTTVTLTGTAALTATGGTAAGAAAGGAGFTEAVSSVIGPRGGR